MRTEWFEWLVLFKKHNSLLKVSEQCHMTPQNINKMFRRMENEIGISLFEKKNGRIGMTPAGMELVTIAENTLTALDELKNKYTQEQILPNGTVKIVGGQRQILENVLMSVMKRYPQIIIQQIDMDFQSAMEYVKENKDALAIVPSFGSEAFQNTLRRYEPYCNIHGLFKDDAKFFVSKHSELANKRSVPFRSLCEKPVVLYSKGVGNFGEAAFEKYVRKKGDFKIHFLPTNSMDYFFTMIEKNIATGMTFSSNCEELTKSGEICSLNIKDADEFMWTECGWNLIYNIHKKFMPHDKAVIQEIEQYCTQFKAYN